MKPVTFTAILALILAIPLFIRGRGPSPARVWIGKRQGVTETDYRYDIDDFLT